MYKVSKLFAAFSFVLIVFVSCKHTHAPQPVEIRLLNNWTFRKVTDNRWYPASVPGDLISDLLANDLIPDPYFGSNAAQLQWIEQNDWEYKTYFDIPHKVYKNENLSLKFDGIDTRADIYLNDSLISQTDDMFLQYEIACKHLLKERGNCLLVHIHSLADNQSKKVLTAASNVADAAPAFGFPRKAMYQYGSDNAPQLINYGIWRKVSLCAWSKARVNDIYLRPLQITAKKAEYEAKINIEASKDGNYDLYFYVNDEQIAAPFPVNLKKGKNNERFNFQIDDPQFWWCNHRGNQPMYNLRVELFSRKEPIAGKTERFGIRTVEWKVDSAGNTSFVLNNTPIFIKGASLAIPDLLSSRVTSSRMEELIKNAVDLNINMLRIRSNSVFENDSLYELCDKYGIMLWHDFMFNPSMCQSDLVNNQQIIDEVHQNVIRLRNHPSIAFWYQNKYPEKGYEMMKPCSRNIDSLIASSVETYSPHIKFYTSYSGSTKQDLTIRGECHDWRVWNSSEPFSVYNNSTCSFVGEYGMQSYPVLRSLSEFIPQDSLSSASNDIQFHQRCQMPWISQNMNGNQMIDSYIQMYYNQPSYFESYVYLSQIMQAEALKTAIESHRANRPQCSGSMFYHLNDSWPAISWSLIDYYGRLKPAWYTVRKAFENVLVTARIVDNNIIFNAINDSSAQFNATLKLRILDFNGKNLWSKNVESKVEANQSTTLWKVPVERLCPESLKAKIVLYVSLESNNKILSDNYLYFTQPMFLDLPVPDITTEIRESNGQFVVNITSDKLARNITLDTENTEARFSDNNIELLPHKTVSITVQYDGSLAALRNDLKVYTLVNSY